MFGMGKEIATKFVRGITLAKTSFVCFGQRKVQFLKGENLVKWFRETAREINRSFLCLGIELGKVRVAHSIGGIETNGRG